MSGASEFDDRIEAFRVRFVARAAEDSERLTRLLTDLTPGDNPGLAEIRKVAHGLVGAGGTFGFPDVSVVAETVESATMEASPDVATVQEAGARLIAMLRGLGG